MAAPPSSRDLFLPKQGRRLKGEIPHRRRHAGGHRAAFRNGHGFDLFLEVGDRFDGTKFDDGEPDRSLKNAQQYELRGDWREAELAGFPFVEESFESPVAQPPGDRLECGKGAHRQGCGLTGILERGVAGISTDGAAFFQQSGITHFRFLTIPRKGVPQSLGQGHPEMEDMARVGSEGIHGAQAETDWEAVAPRAVP